TTSTAKIIFPACKFCNPWSSKNHSPAPGSKRTSASSSLNPPRPKTNPFTKKTPSGIEPRAFEHGKEALPDLLHDISSIRDRHYFGLRQLTSNTELRSILCMEIGTN